MCGIVGAFDLQGRRMFPRERLASMSAALAHRGPDAEGSLFTPGYSAGTRRLILRDPSGGAQPMVDGDASICLNGELFSFSRDRARLGHGGALFATESDTEVFLRGLQCEGLAFLAQADAQFALAYAQNQELLLARDASGIAPLFYTRADGWLLFASEVKGILASGLAAASLNHRAVDHMLTRLALDPGESCFAGIQTLQPGYFLSARDGRITTGRFANAAGTVPQSALRDDENLDRLEQLLFDSVSRRLEADAPVALYLSGGVDSSLIAAMAARIRPSQLTAYSVQLSANERKTDESVYASQTAASLGLHHRVLPAGPGDIIENFPRAVLAAEMPVLDHANVCLLLLAQMVHKDGNKAVLTGEGADEAFGGYPWHALGGSIVRRLVDWIAHNVSTGPTRRTTARFRDLNQYLLFAGLASVRGLFYSKRFLEEIEDTDESCEFAAAASRGSRLSRSLSFDYEWLLAGHLLADKGDRVSMLSSVEARYPFLDSQVKEMAAMLPDDQKIRGTANKWILRKVAERYLPHSTAWRRKHLFRAEPVIHGPRRPLWVDQLLSTEALRKTGLFEPELVRRHLLLREKSVQFSLNPFRDAGLSGVVSTQLLYHLFCGGGLCDLRVAPVSVSESKPSRNADQE